jgi:hypothetical protein
MNTTFKKLAVFLTAFVGAACLSINAKASVASLEARIDAATKNAASARVSLFDAQENLGKALGMKEASLKKIADAKKASDPSKAKVKALTDGAKVTEATNKEIQQLIGDAKPLSPEATALFEKGVANFIDGAVAEAAQIATVTSIAKDVSTAAKSAKGLEKAKLASLATSSANLATMIPADVKSAVETATQLVAFAKANNIEISNASKIAGLLGGF